MKIIWDSIYEVKRLIEIADLEKVREHESEHGWGSAGFIIRESDRKPGEKEVQKPVSDAYHKSDYVIMTPCYKELSWLYRIMKDYPRYGVLKQGDFDEGFFWACKAFFLSHPKYEAKELLLFVVHFLGSIDEQTRNDRQDRRENRNQLTEMNVGKAYDC